MLASVCLNKEPWEGNCTWSLCVVCCNIKRSYPNLEPVAFQDPPAYNIFVYDCSETPGLFLLERRKEASALTGSPEPSLFARVHGPPTNRQQMDRTQCKIRPDSVGLGESVQFELRQDSQS
jgi:hypothetical protein